MKRVSSGWCLVLVCVASFGSHTAGAQSSCSQITTTTVTTSGTDSSRGQALRAAIEGSAGCEIIQLGNATYQIDGSDHEGVNDGVWIKASNLEVRGQGSGSIVKFGRATYVGFAIQSHVHSLTMRNFAIRGSLVPGDDARRRFDSAGNLCTDPVTCFSDPNGPVPNVHGIANHSGITDVANVLITHLDIQDVAVGIALGSEDSAGILCAPATFDHVTISGNFIKNIYGRDSGSGYGINATCVSHALIIDNTLMNTGRHAIYQAKTVLSGNSPDDVVIVHNTSIDHGHVNGTFADPNRNAIVVARSRNASVVDNTIIGSHQPGVSVESESLAVDKKDPPTMVLLRAYNIAVIGNHFLDATTTSTDIWLNAADGSNPSTENVVVWGNSRNNTPIDCASTNTIKADMGHCDSPSYWAVGVGTQWIGFSGAALDDVANAGNLQTNSDLFVMQNNALHRVHPAWGTHPGTSFANAWSYVYSTTDWSYGTGAQGMAVSSGDIYVMQYYTLHRVTPGTTTGAWPYAYSTTSWNPDYEALTTFGGFVYVVQNGVLHRVTPGTTNYQWSYTYSVISGAGALAAGDVLYVRHGTTISKYDGALTYLGDLN